jgi:hypothetical protein
MCHHTHLLIAFINTSLNPSQIANIMFYTSCPMAGLGKVKFVPKGEGTQTNPKQGSHPFPAKSTSLMSQPD